MCSWPPRSTPRASRAGAPRGMFGASREQRAAHACARNCTRRPSSRAPRAGLSDGALVASRVVHAPFSDAPPGAGSARGRGGPDARARRARRRPHPAAGPPVVPGGQADDGPTRAREEEAGHVHHRPAAGGQRSGHRLRFRRPRVRLRTDTSSTPSTTTRPTSAAARSVSAPPSPTRGTRPRTTSVAAPPRSVTCRTPAQDARSGRLAATRARCDRSDRAASPTPSTTSTTSRIRGW